MSHYSVNYFQFFFLQTMDLLDESNTTQAEINDIDQDAILNYQVEGT